MLDIFVFFAGGLLLLVGVLRYAPLIPEPEFPLKTPFGKLPFFDGVILYNLVIFILLCLVKGLLP